MSSDSDLKEAQTDSVEVSEQKTSLQLAIDFADWGWSIIANAGGGDWDKESPEWQKAAAQYRDDFHNTICNLTESTLDAKIRYTDYKTALELLREAHERMGNTAFPALASRITKFLATAPNSELTI